MQGLVGFKADYDSAVAELTINSRPLISSLTDIAAENKAHVHDIVDVIQRRILSVRLHAGAGVEPKGNETKRNPHQLNLDQLNYQHN